MKKNTTIQLLFDLQHAIGKRFWMAGHKIKLEKGKVHTA